MFAGFGGQGILSLGRMLAEGAALQGRHVTFIPSYGAEVRGGISYCHVRVSDEEIYSPVVLRATTLVLMSQDSLRHFRNSLQDGGTALINSSLATVKQPFPRGNHLLIPATEMASGLGDVRVANMVMFGVYDELRQFGLDKHLDACFEKVFPGKKAAFRDLNLRAIEVGRKLYRETLSQQEV